MAGWGGVQAPRPPPTAPRAIEGLYALAAAAGGALAAADEALAALPTPTSAISLFADDEGSSSDVGAVADLEGFIVRAVALERG